MTASCATEGHTLVIPKAHSRNLFDIPDSDLTAVVRMARNIAQLQRERLGCEGVTFQANEPAGFQTMFHFHVHVVPRWKGDALRESWHARAADLSRWSKSRASCAPGSPGRRRRLSLWRG